MNHAMQPEWQSRLPKEALVVFNSFEGNEDDEPITLDLAFIEMPDGVGIDAEWNKEADVFRIRLVKGEDWEGCEHWDYFRGDDAIDKIISLANEHRSTVNG